MASPCADVNSAVGEHFWPRSRRWELSGSVYRLLVRSPHLRVHRTLLSFAALCVVPVTLSACSSSPARSATTTTNPSNRTLCTTVGPAQIAATTGLQVGPAQTTSTKTLVTCTYQGTDLSKSVIVRYAVNVTPTEFTSQATKASSQYGPIGHLSHLGDAAYYFTVPAKDQTITTLVLIHGEAEIVITSTATLTQNENLAQLILFGFSPKK